METSDIEAHFKRFGSRLPERLGRQLRLLEARLS
jgi:hypothetical protein